MQTRLATKFISNGPIYYYERGVGCLALPAGEYEISQLPVSVASELIRLVDGKRSYLLLPDGTTQPRHCFNPHYKALQGLADLLNRHCTPSAFGPGVLWETSTKECA